MSNEPSRKEKIAAFAGGICAGLILLGAVIFAIPDLRDRISWRLDFAMAYVRGVVDPVRPMPTAVIASINTGSAEVPEPDFQLPHQDFTATPSPEPEPTLQATLEPTFTPAPTLTPTQIPGSVNLSAPAYEKQDLNNCGPATLAMNLRYYGWEGDQKTISDLIKPKREDRNVNVEELVGYVGTDVAGLEMIYRVGGDIEILKKLLAAGFPVTIEEAFIMQESYWMNDDRWAGHYLLLTGYDDEKRIFTAQDVFVGPNLTVKYEVMDERWKAFNRVYMVVYSEDQVPALQSILGEMWDMNQNRQHALEKAQKETEADSTDSFAWFNLGTNLVYFEKYSQAAAAYDQARENNLPQRMLRYQFGPFFAYFHTGRIDDLLALTDYALGRTPTSEEAMLWRGWAMYRKGDIAGAESLFLNALDARPGYPDAQYSLQFIREN